MQGTFLIAYSEISPFLPGFYSDSHTFSIYSVLQRKLTALPIPGVGLMVTVTLIGSEL